MGWDRSLAQRSYGRDIPELILPIWTSTGRHHGFGVQHQTGGVAVADLAPVELLPPVCAFPPESELPIRSTLIVPMITMAAAVISTTTLERVPWDQN